MTAKPRIPLWRWGVWWVAVLLGDFLFYVVAHARVDRAAGARVAGGVPCKASLTDKLPAYDNICAPMTRYVYDFDEPSEGGRDLLGGKGIGLAEMTQLGIPVPAGFTITTDASRAFMASGGEVEGLDEEVAEHIARLEQQTGKRFGDPEDPLLVSVRSGAAVSMPGMMDTILNVGLNDESVEGLARSTGNEEFARDCYRRLIQMFGETVDDIPHESFSVEDSVERAREIYEHDTGQGFPQDAREQLRRAITAVFDSWNSSRAQVYRNMYGIPDDLGTAVNVVQMVFGNKGEDSATGVCFTRNPSTGEQGVYGEYLVNAQGEDVVAGTRTPQPLAELRERMPEAYDQLLETMGCARAPLPRHAGHRVHRRAGAPLPPADAHREADGGGRDQVRGRHDRGRADRAGRGGGADRPGPARPAAPSRASTRTPSSRSPRRASTPRPAPPAGRSCSTPTAPRSAARPARR